MQSKEAKRLGALARLEQNIGVTQDILGMFRKELQELHEREKARKKAKTFITPVDSVLKETLPAAIATNEKILERRQAEAEHLRKLISPSIYKGEARV